MSDLEKHESLQEIADKWADAQASADRLNAKLAATGTPQPASVGGGEVVDHSPLTTEERLMLAVEGNRQMLIDIENFRHQNANLQAQNAKLRKQVAGLAGEVIYEGDAVIKGYHFTFGSDNRFRELELDLEELPPMVQQGEVVTVTMRRKAAEALQAVNGDGGGEG